MQFCNLNNPFPRRLDLEIFNLLMCMYIQGRILVFFIILDSLVLNGKKRERQEPIWD